MINTKLLEMPKLVNKNKDRRIKMGTIGLDFDKDLFQGNKDKTLLCFCLSLIMLSVSLSPFLSFGAQGEIMIIRERKSYYHGCSLIM